MKAKFKRKSIWDPDSIFSELGVNWDKALHLFLVFLGLSCP